MYESSSDEEDALLLLAVAKDEEIERCVFSFIYCLIAEKVDIKRNWSYGLIHYFWTGLSAIRQITT